VTATVWNSGQKSGNIGLSGGNLVATSTGAGGVRSDHPLSGLTYFSAVITTLTGTPQIGIASGTWDNATALGNGSNTLGFQPNGAVRVNNVTLATIAAYVAGNRVDAAINIKDRLAWFRVAGGNWNNNAANDPATNTGGIDISSLVQSTMWAAVSASLTGTVWSAEFSATFTNAPPTGYQSLDVPGYTIAIGPTPRDGMPGLVPASFNLVAPLRGADNLGRAFMGTAYTVVSGVTKESGAPVADKKVEVYDRDTGELLGSTRSDGSGAWLLCALGRPSVRVVGSDPTTYNSVVFDNVVPV
jgi:hypothetical protein